MNIDRVAGFAILACVLSSCAPARPVTGTSNAPAVSAQATVEQSLTTLESVLDFKAMSRKRYDDPALGVFVRYTRPDGLEADMYAYPVTDAAKDTSLDRRRATAMAEAGNALLGIRMYGERGVYKDVVVGESTQFEVAGASGYVMPGVLIPVSLRLDGVLKHSDIIVLDLHGVFIKVRSTYPIPLANAGARADVRRFTDALVTALERSFTRPTTPQ